MNNSPEIRLGIAGTAKNTGKTTVTANIVEELHKRNLKFYLTSIGYDGENIDNVTGLPKPKLRVAAGDMVVTAERCLLTSTADLEVLDETDILTPLGRVVITKAKKPGLVVTAGPNKSAEVRRLNTLLSKMGPGITLFDGALNRIAPMSETDGFILATGAAKTPDVSQLAEETKIIWRVCNLPIVPQGEKLAEHRMSVVTRFSPQYRIIKTLPTPCLLLESHIADIIHTDREAGGYLYIPGVASEKALKILCAKLEKQPGQVSLVFADSIKILAAGNPLAYYELIDRFQQAGIFVGVLKRIPLLAVTVNPFYSEYRVESDTYTPQFVDAELLQASVQNAVEVPVYNIVEQGPDALVDIILRHHTRREEHP